MEPTDEGPVQGTPENTDTAVSAPVEAPAGTGVTDERVAAYESTADEPEEPGAFQRWYDHVTDDWSREKPWYELPKALGLAQLIGIRDTLRQQNLYDTSRLPAVNATTVAALRGAVPHRAHAGRELERP